MTEKVHRDKHRGVNVSRLVEKLRRSIEESVGAEPLDWVLLLLYAAGGKIPSRIHVQKALFIASRYISELGEMLEFKAYRMGPWSEEVNDALEVAQLSGLVSESSNGVSLSSQGAAKARALWSKLNEKYRKVLSDVASFVKAMSEDELLLYVYVVYGHSEKSDVINKLLRRRKELATRMLRKGLVSVELAARIAGEPLPRFIEYLRKKGIKPLVAEVSDIDEAEKL